MIQAGEHIKNPVWTTNKSEAIHKNIQWGNTCHHLSCHWRLTWSTAVAIRIETSKHSKLPDNPSSWPTNRPVPEETSILVTGLRLLCCCVCHCLRLVWVWFLKTSYVCRQHEQRGAVLVWHWLRRCDACLQPSWPYDEHCGPLQMLPNHTYFIKRMLPMIFSIVYPLIIIISSSSII